MRFSGGLTGDVVAVEFPLSGWDQTFGLQLITRPRMISLPHGAINPVELLKELDLRPMTTLVTTLRSQLWALPEGAVGILNPYQLDSLTQPSALVLFQSLYTNPPNRR